MEFTTEEFKKQNVATFVIDIDHTICIAEKKEDGSYDYENAIPNVDMIKHINKLHEKGNHIILFTARGMRTFEGDVNELKLYHMPILNKWLEENHVKYDILKFGKPWGENVFYIDDRNLTPKQFLSSNDVDDAKKFRKNNNYGFLTNDKWLTK